jgi:plasmid replication initiation protein
MTETSISTTDEKSESYTSVISYAKFNYNADLRVEIRENILKLINETKNQFTIIDANNIMQLTSKHSIRMLMLLEYISGFSSNVAKRKTYTLDELNLLFGTNYKRINHFEENILVPIKDELDATSKISFEYRINYDKKNNTVGRAKAVSVTIDLIQRKFTQGTL